MPKTGTWSQEWSNTWVNVPVVIKIRKKAKKMKLKPAHKRHAKMPKKKRPTKICAVCGAKHGPKMPSQESE